MQMVEIKSDIKGRVRLKSDAFKASNLRMIEGALSSYGVNMRLNATCRSLVIVYNHAKVSLEAIFQALEAALPLLVVRPKEEVEEGYCGT